MYLLNHGVANKFDSDGKLVSKTYSFKIGVVDKYLFDISNTNFDLKFAVVDYNDNILTTQTHVEIERQQIDNTMIKHFASVDEYAENKTEYNLGEYYQSNSLVTGYPGLLQVDIFPKYANVDYVEIVSSEYQGSYISLEQLVAVYDSTNTIFDGFYQTYTQDRELILGGRGIRLGKYSNKYTFNNQDNYYFNGTFYIRTMIPNLPLGSVDFTLSINCYLDGAIVATNQIVINVTKCPTVDLTADDEFKKTGILAFGSSIEITAVTNSTITWSLTSKSSGVKLNNVMTTVEPQYDSAKDKYILTSYPITQLISNGGYGNYETMLQALIGKEFTLTATVSIEIKGRVYSTSDTLTIKLALFTIDSVGVKYVENGNFSGTFNQPYDLIGYIAKATYDENYDKANNNVISNVISRYSDIISKAETKSFYMISNGMRVLLTDEPHQKSDFWIEKVGDYYVIKNNMRYPTSSLELKIDVEYTSYSNRSEEHQYGIIINPKSYSSRDYIRDRDTRFGLDFVRLSNEESPEPIYTQAELANMEEGGYYILLSDITLNNWTPIDTAIASLDGNGYVITINNNSFYDTTIDAPDEDSSNTEKLALGIFSTISSRTTIKNLTIEVKPTDGVITDSILLGSDINIPVEYYAEVKFGLLSAENNGIITNVNVTNNANKLRNERNKLLVDRGLVSAGTPTNLSETNIVSYVDNENNPKTMTRRLTTIYLNYGSLTSTSTTNRIGGLVGVNNGYISNSSIDNINIKGLDWVAGFVAENTNIISSSYFAGGSVNAQVSAENVDDLGASAFVFYNTGRIKYSYSAGARFVEDGIVLSLSGVEDLTKYTGASYDASQPIRLRSTGVTSESGNTSGFVYSNTGSIDDCYSNILVYGRLSAGFIFENQGAINNVYTLSSVLSSDANNNPFISLIENNTKANNSGTITNAYYVKAVESDRGGVGSAPVDLYLNESKQVASAISIAKLASYNTFESFAFNSNYDSADPITYSTNTIRAIDEIARSVWFYPNSTTQNSSYFKKTNYTFGAPQLVSANLNTFSLKYFVSDNSTKIINYIYADLLETYPQVRQDFSKNSIKVSTIETNINSLISQINVNSEDNTTVDKNTVISTLNSYANLGITDPDGLYGNITSSSIENRTIQYIKVSVYLANDFYEQHKSNMDFVNAIVRDTINSRAFEIVSYVDVKLYNIKDTTIPATTVTYDYYAILENTSGDSIEYGNSILNPYIIKTAKDYNVYIMQTDSNGKNSTEKNFKSNKYLRLVSDITFNSSELIVKTFNVDYSGVFDGNGMSMQDIRINADTTKSSNAINQQQSSNYEENEYYVLKTINVTVDTINGHDEYSVIINGNKYTIKKISSAYKLFISGLEETTFKYKVNVNGSGVPASVDILRKATSVGIFAKLNNGAVVKNLDITIAELYATGVNFVGTIAGQVINSKVYNITVSGDAVVFGHNIVGGVVGRVEGLSSVVNANSNVSVTATYYSNYNKFDKDNIDFDKDSTYNVYQPRQYDADGQLVGSSRFSDVSYAGGIIGVVDLDKDELNSDIDTSYIGKIRFNTNNLTSFIRGEIVGGLYGYVGANSVVSASKLFADSSSKLDASRVSGGLVGQNHGTIERSYVSYTEAQQQSIDESISKLNANVTQTYGDSVYSDDMSIFVGNAHFIGGMVGLNISGKISNSYSKINVSQINSMYAGGLVGATIGGELNAVYTTADVYSFYAYGGVVGLATMYLAPGADGSDNIISANLLIANILDINGITEQANLSMHGVVAINLWKADHLNVRRSYINPQAQDEANVGSLIGFKKSIDTVVEDNNSKERDSY